MRCFRAACSSRSRPGSTRQAVARTRALLADPAVPAIFEAAFEYAGVRIRADVLERLPGGGFGLREVKASASVKPEHLDDCAVQLHVLEGCGLRIASVELVHVNRDYVRDAGAIDWPAFFARVDLTREVAAALPGVRERLPRFHAVVRAPSAPEIEPSGHCFAPHDCEFWDHCTRNKPDDWIFHLPRIGNRFEALRAAGIERIVDIPDELPLPDAHAPDPSKRFGTGELKIEPGPREHASRSRPACPLPRLRDDEPGHSDLRRHAAVRGHPLPMVAPHGRRERPPASPRIPGRRSRRPAPRICRDARRRAAATTSGPCSSTRASRAPGSRRLAELHPDLAPALGRIRDRLFDLLPIVRSHVYHPDFGLLLLDQGGRPGARAGPRLERPRRDRRGGRRLAGLRRPRGRPGPGRRARAPARRSAQLLRPRHAGAGSRARGAARNGFLRGDRSAGTVECAAGPRGPSQHPSLGESA